jgi:predicted transcriptional regulator
MKTQTDMSVEQLNAIELLALGKTDQESADAVGVTRQTVNKWCNHDSRFEVALNLKRQELWAGHADALRAMVRRALEVLAEDMGADDLRLRQAAAVQILRAAGMYGLGAPQGQTDPLLADLDSLLR